MGAAIKGKTSMKPMIRFSWLTFNLAGFIHSVTANETFRFDASRSTIGFRVHQFLGTTDGKFTQFSGTIDLDRQHPEASSVSARIQVSSINTGIKKRDDHLRSPEFFNVAKFPEITFRSRSVKKTGQQSGDILDRKSTRLNSSHTVISYAVFCLKK